MCSDNNHDFMSIFNKIGHYRCKNHPKRISEVSVFYLDFLMIYSCNSHPDHLNRFALYLTQKMS
jgi:hypothetical protein